MKRRFLQRARCAGCTLAVFVAVGCGAGSKESAPAQTPAAAPAYGAPAEDESVRAKESPSAPASDKTQEQQSAAPAAGAAFPGSTKNDSRGEPMDEIETLSRRLEGALT